MCTIMTVDVSAIEELLARNANYTFLCKFMALFNTGGSSLDIVYISGY